jgi:hypothetical protein
MLMSFRNQRIGQDSAHARTMTTHKIGEGVVEMNKRVLYRGAKTNLEHPTS